MSELPAPDLELPEPPDPGEPYLLLEAAGRAFGVALPEVLEVVSPRACTHLPGAAAEVLGLVNLRGRVVTVIDLATALGLLDRPDTPGRVVVVDHRGSRVGLSVDDAPRILMIDPAGLEPPGGDEPLPVYASTEAEGRPFAILDTGALLGPVLA
jgi:purine-binding chemotaxis protein CheW